MIIQIEEEEEEATIKRFIPSSRIAKVKPASFRGRIIRPCWNANLSTPRGYGVYGTALAWLWPRPRANLYRNHQNVTTSGKRCWRPAEGDGEGGTAGTSLKFTLNIHRDRGRWQEADGTEIGAFLIELMRYWKLVEVSSFFFPIFRPRFPTFSRGSIEKFGWRVLLATFLERSWNIFEGSIDISKRSRRI